MEVPLILLPRIRRLPRLASQPLHHHCPPCRHMDQRCCPPSDNLPMSQSIQEILSPLECGHLHVGLPDLERRMSVGRSGREYVIRIAMLSDELDPAHDVALQRRSCVECLDDVHVGQDIQQRLIVDVFSPEPIERMRDLDDTALVLDPFHCFFRGQIAGDLVLEEEADDLPVSRSQLRADDDRERCDLLDRESATDRMVVCDGYSVQSGSQTSLDQGFWSHKRVRRGLSVDMEVDAHGLKGMRSLS